jgi:uncharacterized membrane protein YhaH (DUF805 family)
MTATERKGEREKEKETAEWRERESRRRWWWWWVVVVVVVVPSPSFFLSPPLLSLSSLASLSVLLAL